MEGKNVKIVQFADDTTIFLDGSESSLKQALNILEVYGSYSGLKVNKEKTQLIWIGRNRKSRKKLCTTTPLCWETSKFKMLGVTFAVDLKDTPQINFEPLIDKISKMLVPWQNRILTPLGKVFFNLSGIKNRTKLTGHK